MLRFKKIVVTICTVTMVMGMSSVSFAGDNQGADLDIMSKLNIQEEIYRAEQGITDIPVTDEMKDSVIATMKDGVTGEVVPMDVDFTVKKLDTQLTRNGSSETVYALTAVTRGQKTTSDSIVQSGIVAYGTMVWIDNPGSDNELIRVSGGWDLDQDGAKVVGGREAHYGGRGFGGEMAPPLYPKINSFAANCSITHVQLQLKTFANIESPSGDADRIALEIIPLF